MLRFCGKRFDTAGCDVVVDVEDNTQKPTYIDRSRAHPVTNGEERELKSVVGS